MNDTANENEPDEVFENIRRELQLARVLGERVIVTWWLLVSNVVLWLVAKFYGLTLSDAWGMGETGINAEQLVFFTGMKINEQIVAGEWWRLLSSMWVHLDIFHIAFNGYGIYILGPLLEKFYGARRFFVLYLLSGLFAAWASYQFNEIPSGGASGAIYGLVGALLVFGVKYRNHLPKRVSRALTTGMLPWVIVSIGIGFFAWLPFDNAAHIGGLVSGGALALILGTKLNRRTQRIGGIILWLLSIVGSVWIVATAALWSQEATTCLKSQDAFVSCYPEIARRTEQPPPPTE